MPKRIAFDVWVWESGLQFVYRESYVYLSWRWPFVTVSQQPEAGA